MPLCCWLYHMLILHEGGSARQDTNLILQSAIIFCFSLGMYTKCKKEQSKSNVRTPEKVFISWEGETVLVLLHAI